MRFVFSERHGGTSMRFGICKQWDLLLHRLGQVLATGLVLAWQRFKMGFVGRALYLRSWPSLASFGCGVPDDSVVHSPLWGGGADECWPFVGARGWHDPLSDLLTHIGGFIIIVTVARPNVLRKRRSGARWRMQAGNGKHRG